MNETILVRGITGYSADSVPPVGLGHPIPVVLDRSLKRFDIFFAIAGDPQCVFKISFDDLKRLTGAIVSWNIAAPWKGKSNVRRCPGARPLPANGWCRA